MMEWLMFVLFLAAGLGMLMAGVFYMQKEKGDSESVKIYRIVSLIGLCLSIVSVIFKFVL